MWDDRLMTIKPMYLWYHVPVPENFIVKYISCYVQISVTKTAFFITKTRYHLLIGLLERNNA